MESLEIKIATNSKNNCIASPAIQQKFHRNAIEYKIRNLREGKVGYQSSISFEIHTNNLRKD